MSAHTPGPWIADSFDELERSWGVFAQGAKPGSKQPAECRGKDAEANARLMAAAPDLLAALAGLVGCIMAEHGNGADLLPVSAEDDPEHYAAVVNARAAIAKAKGEA